METKRTKYDTNPLDPDYVKQTEEAWSQDDDGPGTREVKGATREFRSSANDCARNNIYSVAPTIHCGNPPQDSRYASVFVPLTYSSPPPYQATPYIPPQVNLRPTQRT